ncbi:MAG TPA: MBL fold metallo-hydrolase [Vicinamibacterales bacterium]|nr:MBL fold metallo-hydrolase [Vicinamibacterales bacterium]
MEMNTTRHNASRRRFLRTAGLLSGSAIVFRNAPQRVLDAFQDTPLEQRRSQMGAIPIVTTRLTDRVALLTGPGGNVVVLHGPGGIIVVDGFVKPAWPKLKAALAAIDSVPIKSLVDTHWHFDHADNNGNFRSAGAGVIAHENTRTRLMESHDILGMHFDPVPSAELPTQTFASGLTLNLNGEQVDLQHVAPAHTDTDIFVYFPKADVLHMGDVFFNGRYPFIDASTGGHINGMIDGVGTALKRVTAQTKIVPGHGALGSRASLETYGRMLTVVRDRVGTAKKAGKSLADVQAAKPTAEFDEAWGKGTMTPNDFVASVYNTVK